ncbi:MAG: chemotaxis protein CheX [Bacteriovoracaceae bacterium]|nr:chemotaxis protein CheX [Bacteriovoracaceae bacterium]
MTKVVLLSKKTALAGDLKRRLKEDAGVVCDIFEYRPEVVEHITKFQTDGLIMIDLDTSRDIALILKGVAFSLNPDATKVIILSEDLSRAAESFEEFESMHIKILSLHESIETIVKEINVHLSEEIKQDLVKEGKEAAKLEKPATTNGSAVTMNMEFLKVFVDASKDVVAQMSGDSSISHGSPVFLSKMEELPDIAIRSRIEIISEHFKGSFFISFPKESYLGFIEIVLGERMDSIDEENKDFILELANIVYGQSKRILNSSGFELDMKFPEYYDNVIESSSPVFVIPYVTNFGPFYIKVAPNLL